MKTMAVIAAIALCLPLPAQAADTRALLLFWRDDCAPCRDELQVVPLIAAQHPELAIRLLSLKGVPENPPKEVRVEIVQGEGWRTMASYGGMRPALPFSAMLHADGSTCASHYGVLGTDTVDEWMKSC